ncbi:MAG: hypothetical protein R2813_09050 [Flavobacteriales bacterium]
MRRAISSVLGVLCFVQTYSQELQWLEGRKTQYEYNTYGVPGSAGRVAIIDKVDGKSPVLKATIYDFGRSEPGSTIDLLEKGKANDQILTRDVVSIGGVLYAMQEGKSAKGNFAMLKPLDDGHVDMQVNSIPNSNPDNEDMLINVCGVSPNQSYSAVYSYTIKSKTSRDNMAGVPYLNLFFAYHKQRENDFYVRPNSITVFDKEGKMAWTKSFQLGQQDTGVYVRSIDVTEAGEVFMHVEESPIRFNYFEAPYYFKTQSTLALHKQTGYTKGLYFLSREIDQPTKLPIVLSDEIDVLAEQYFNNENFYIRVASIGVDNGGTSVFAGMLVQVLNPKYAGRTFVKLSASDLRNSFNKKTERKREKGKDFSIKIGRPTPRFVDIDSEHGITILMEEFYQVSSSGATKTKYNYITFLNSDFEGELKWSKVVEHDHEINKFVLVERGGIHAVSDQNDIVVLMNDNDKEWPWSGDNAQLIRLMRFDKLGNLISDNTVDAFKQPIMPRKTFMMDGELILIGNAMPYNLDFKVGEKAVVGKLKL